MLLPSPRGKIKMEQTIIQKYAELIVRSGIALKAGEKVIISANVDQEDFVTLLVEEAYRLGAKRVIVQWTSQKVSKANLLYGDEEELSQLTPMDLAYWKFRGEELPSFIWVDSDDPDGSKGTDSSKAARIRQAQYKIYGKYKEMTENKIAWCIAGAPAKEWAMKVFPKENEKEAMEKLWEAILLTSRALDGNGIVNWEKHDINLKNAAIILTPYVLKNFITRLKRYGSSCWLDPWGYLSWRWGTHHGWKILPAKHSFRRSLHLSKRGEAEGIVYSAKPLVYNGVLITYFWVKFHEGKAVDVHAETGEEALRSILSLDEGSAYLGECALVPFDSPINNTGLLFYNTLYDENAACHLALGRGFTELYPDYHKYSDEELYQFGINRSLSHVDFMIGSKDLNIVGTKENGEEVQLFKNGNWAFDID